MATERGVIYYKLDSQNLYDGDMTKNCGLTGNEIDGNFHFLRGHDIKSFGVSDDKSELIISRFNGEELAINVHKELKGYEFAYDKANGVLSITSPDGSLFDLKGFLTERIFHVYGDSTIDGDGTRYNPISVSPLAKTGTYAPAKKIINTINGETLPIKNIAKGERYVTKEKVSKLGLLYPLEGVIALQKRLEELGSEWRVPTKDDWDQLLNISENCEEGKNHNDPTNPTNKYLGMVAGENLKSTNYWEMTYRRLEDGEVVVDGERYSRDENGAYVIDNNGEYYGELKSTDKFGFSIYPAGFADRRGVDTIGGFGKWAAFWTASEEDKYQDMYVKVFSNEESGVEQNSWGKGCYLSLRLVKDYNGNNLYDTETIDGNTVATIYVEPTDYSDRERYSNTLIWTKENIGFSNPSYMGVKSKEWETSFKEDDVVRYYLNVWDGVKWLKSEIKEGDSIVLLEENGVEMHEWRIVEGECIDTADIIRGELQEDVTYLKSEISSINERTVKMEESVANTEKIVSELQNNSSKLKEVVENIAVEVSDEIANRVKGDEILDVKLFNETSERTKADTDLQIQIDQNHVYSLNDTLVVNEGSTDENGTVEGTKISVKLPENGMIKFDEFGLYFDGDFSFGGNLI